MLSKLSKQEARHSLVGPGRLWQQKRAFQIAFLLQHGLQPHHILMDIGCGTLRGGIPIIAYLDAGNYIGLDCSEERLREAGDELLEHELSSKHPDIRLYTCLDDVRFTASPDVFWAFSVLIHMPDNMTASCIRLVRRHMSTNSVFYSNVLLGDDNTVTPPGAWPIVTRPMDFYSTAAAAGDLKVEILGTLRELGHVTGFHSHDNQVMLKWTLSYTA